MNLNSKLIIAGTRTFDDYRKLKKEVNRFIYQHALLHPEIVCGTPWDTKLKPMGADQLGARFALEQGYSIKEFPALWPVHGRAAGPIRNQEMAEYATHCIVFWDGISHGTENMIKHATHYNLVLKVIKTNG